MQTNLRRAHQIRSLIETALVSANAAILRPLTVQVLDEKVEDKIRKAESEAVAENEKASRLEDILGSLRLAISNANHDSLIDEKLARQATLKRKLDRVKPFVNQSEDSSDELRTKLKQAKSAFERQAGSDRYGRNVESVTEYIVPNTIIEGAKTQEVQFRRDIRKIADELLASNFSTKVEILDTDIQYLEQVGVI